jgi:hypothetical protein
MIAQYVVEFPYNNSFRRMLESFTDNSVNYVQTADKDHPGVEITQIGHGWAPNIIFGCASFREAGGTI